MHVLEHSVQCGVEKSCRPAALGPESHQLRALGEARENCVDKKTKGQMLQSPVELLQLRLRLVRLVSLKSGKCKMLDLKCRLAGLHFHLPSAAQVMVASLSTLISASSSSS